jgi:hypothetical protein
MKPPSLPMTCCHPQQTIVVVPLEEIWDITPKTTAALPEYYLVGKLRKEGLSNKGLEGRRRIQQ